MYFAHCNIMVKIHVKIPGTFQYMMTFMKPTEKLSTPRACCDLIKMPVTPKMHEKHPKPNLVREGILKLATNISRFKYPLKTNFFKMAVS